MKSICNKCGKQKDASCFRAIQAKYVFKSGKVRTSQYARHVCKECLNAQRDKANRKKYNKLYYLKNKDALKEKQRERYERDKDKIKAYIKRWAAKNPIKTRAHKARRRSAEGRFNDSDIISIYKNQKGLCYYCMEPLYNKYDIDHFIPVSKGGTNYPSNLRLACQACNNRKRAKNPYEFIQAEFGRLF